MFIRETKYVISVLFFAVIKNQVIPLSSIDGKVVVVVNVFDVHPFDHFIGHGLLVDVLKKYSGTECPGT